MEICGQDQKAKTSLVGPMSAIRFQYSLSVWWESCSVWVFPVQWFRAKKFCATVLYAVKAVLKVILVTLSI